MALQNSDLDTLLQSRTDAFVAEISTMVRKAAMEALSDALASGDTTTRKPKTASPRGAKAVGKPRAAKKKRGGRRVRRSAEDLEQLSVTIHSHINANPGQRLEQIGAALDTDTAELKRPVFLLLEGKKLRTTGQRRGTKYFAKGRV